MNEPVPAGTNALHTQHHSIDDLEIQLPQAQARLDGKLGSFNMGKQSGARSGKSSPNGKASPSSRDAAAGFAAHIAQLQSSPGKARRQRVAEMLRKMDRRMANQQRMVDDWKTGRGMNAETYLDDRIAYQQHRQEVIKQNVDESITDMYKKAKHAKGSSNDLAVNVQQSSNQNMDPSLLNLTSQPSSARKSVTKKDRNRDRLGKVITNFQPPKSYYEHQRNRLNYGASLEFMQYDKNVLESARKMEDDGSDATKEQSLDRLRNFYGGMMDEGLRDALKRKIAENSLDSKGGVLPISYVTRSCADILSTALLSPTSDDAAKFWNKDSEEHYIVQSGYQYSIGKMFPMQYQQPPRALLNLKKDFTKQKRSQHAIHEQQSVGSPAGVAESAGRTKSRRQTILSASPRSRSDFQENNNESSEQRSETKLRLNPENAKRSSCSVARSTPRRGKQPKNNEQNGAPPAKMNKIHLFKPRGGANKDLEKEKVRSQTGQPFHLSKIKEKAKELNDSVDPAQTGNTLKEMKVQDNNQLDQTKRSSKSRKLSRQKRNKKVKESVCGSFDKKMVQSNLYQLNDFEKSYLSFSGQIARDVMESHKNSQQDESTLVQADDQSKELPTFKNLDSSKSSLAHIGGSNETDSQKQAATRGKSGGNTSRSRGAVPRDQNTVIDIGINHDQGSKGNHSNENTDGLPTRPQISYYDLQDEQEASTSSRQITVQRNNLGTRPDRLHRRATKQVSQQMYVINQSIKESVSVGNDDGRAEVDTTPHHSSQNFRSDLLTKRMSFFDLSSREQEIHIQEGLRKFDADSLYNPMYRGTLSNVFSQNRLSDFPAIEKAPKVSENPFVRNLSVSRIYKGKPYSVVKDNNLDPKIASQPATVTALAGGVVSQGGRTNQRISNMEIVPVLRQQSQIHLKSKVVPCFQYRPENYPLLLGVYQKRQHMENLRSQRALAPPQMASKLSSAIEETQIKNSELSTNSQACLSVASAEHQKRLLALQKRLATQSEHSSSTLQQSQQPTQSTIFNNRAALSPTDRPHLSFLTQRDSLQPQSYPTTATLPAEDQAGQGLGPNVSASKQRRLKNRPLIMAVGGPIGERGPSGADSKRKE